MRHSSRLVQVAAVLLVLLSGDWSGKQSPLFAQGPDRIDVLIGFRDAPGAAELALVRANGGSVKRAYHLVPAVAASIPAPALAALQANPRVRVVEPDGIFTADDDAVIAAELSSAWGVNKIGAGQVHAAGNVGAGVKVAIIDTGVDCGHLELMGTGHCSIGYDFVNGDTDAADDNGHGTHVAGTIGAYRNNGGVVGVAPAVEIVPLKVLGANGSGSFSAVISALEWAVDHGIQVTNNSYGSSSDPGSTVHDAFDAAYLAGIVNIASAGNSGICSAKTNSVGYPGRYTSVLAVAATDINNARSCWSSSGPDVDISAPGVSINSTKMGGGYVVYSGTSMASPHVVGAAALVIKAGVTNLNGINGVADEVRNILTSTALDLGAAGEENLYGYGLVQAVAAVAAAGSGGGGGGGGGGGTVTVAGIAYSASGGRDGTKNLVISVTLKDGNNAPVAGASVSVALTRNFSPYGSASGTTGASGTVSFTANNAPSGTYSTQVTNVSAAGLTWDGTTPSNSVIRP